jgi:hypothetical protein
MACTRFSSGLRSRLSSLYSCCLGRSRGSQKNAHDLLLQTGGKLGGLVNTVDPSEASMPLNELQVTE